MQEGSKLDEENNSQQYFIGILRAAYDLLSSVGKDRINTSKSSGTTKKKKKNKAKQGANKNDALNNLFAHLQVKEPSLQPLDSEPVPRAPDSTDGRTRTAGKVPQFRLEEESDDVAFQLWCFSEDINDMRSFISETWREYVRGEVSVVAAGLITTTGFILMRQANEEVTQSHPEICEYWHIHSFLRLQLIAHPHVAALMPIEADAKQRQPHRYQSGGAAVHFWRRGHILDARGSECRLENAQCS